MFTPQDNFEQQWRKKIIFFFLRYHIPVFSECVLYSCRFASNVIMFDVTIKLLNHVTYGALQWAMASAQRKKWKDRKNDEDKKNGGGDEEEVTMKRCEDEKQKCW